MKLLSIALLGMLTISGASQAGELFQPIKATPGKVFQGGCHMGECVFLKFLSSSVVSRPGGEIVVVLNEQVGIRSGVDKSPIQWNAPSAVRVSCSYVRPAVAFSVDGEAFAHALTLSPNDSIPGYQTISAQTYFRACHNFTLQDASVEDAVVKFGYDVITD